VTNFLTSVLIPSFRRPQPLISCIQSLARQTVKPGEVIVVWQGDDVVTKETVNTLNVAAFPCDLKLLHSEEVGIVPAENLALTHAKGDILFLIDDDAVAPVDWIAKHLTHYADPTVGAVGGPGDNFTPEGIPFPKRARRTTGKLTWYGKSIGNMYDQDINWRLRNPIQVDHLVGYNMSIRRKAFGKFEQNLKPYWQNFEIDVCFQVKARGYRVIFDFANVIKHYPTNQAYAGGREGDLTVKIYNAAYNQAYVLAKHSPWFLRPWRILYLLLIGSTNAPGLFTLPLAFLRFGGVRSELLIFRNTCENRILGWKDGSQTRKSERPSSWHN
jgi:glycosyltransferase involved in cell wall biosynthesis